MTAPRRRSIADADSGEAPRPRAYPTPPPASAADDAKREDIPVKSDTSPFLTIIRTVRAEPRSVTRKRQCPDLESRSSRPHHGAKPGFDQAFSRGRREPVLCAEILPERSISRAQP